MAYPLEVKQKAFECYLMGYTIPQISEKSVELLGQFVPISRLNEWRTKNDWVKKKTLLDQKTLQGTKQETKQTTIENNLTGLEPQQKTLHRNMPGESAIVKKVFKDRTELLEWQNEILSEYEVKFQEALKEGGIRFRGSDLVAMMAMHRDNFAVLKNEAGALKEIAPELLASPRVAEALANLERIIQEEHERLISTDVESSS